MIARQVAFFGSKLFARWVRSAIAFFLHNDPIAIDAASRHFGSVLIAYKLAALLFFLRNLRARFSCFTEGDCDSLLAAFDLLSAAGLQLAFLMLFHHLVDL